MRVRCPECDFVMPLPPKVPMTWCPCGWREPPAADEEQEDAWLSTARRASTKTPSLMPLREPDPPPSFGPPHAFRFRASAFVSGCPASLRSDAGDRSYPASEWPVVHRVDLNVFAHVRPDRATAPVCRADLP